MPDIEPLKGLSDTEEDCEDSPPTGREFMTGDEFGTYFAIALGIFIFFIFAVGSIKG
jgi:hypothetical protein